MKNYEIMILIHPDQGERLQNMLKKYRSLIEKENGKIHRLEDLGRRQLSYQIKNLHKAHYILINIECKIETMNNLNKLFKFNDSVIRSLILKRDIPINKTSILKK